MISKKRLFQTSRLAKIREQVKFSQEDVIIPEESIRHVVSNYCDKEDMLEILRDAWKSFIPNSTYTDL